MLHCIPKLSSLVWSSEPLLGFKVAKLHSGASHVGCFLASVGTTEPAGATFPEISGKAGLIRRTYVGTQIEEPSEIREPGLEKGKA